MARVHGPQPEGGFHFLHAHHGRPLPELPLDHVDEAVCEPTHVREPHSHATLEMLYMLSGRMIRTAGGKRTVIGPGDFFINPPREAHGAAADPADPPHLFAIGVDPVALAAPVFARDVDLAAAQATALVEIDPPFERRAIHGGQGAEVIYRRLLAELDRIDAVDPRRRALGVAQVQALIVELFVFAARCSLAEPAGAAAAHAPERDALRRLIGWLEGRLADPPSLAEMAARAGLSTAHFTVVFRREMGVTPLEYLTQRRIDAAGRALLEPGATITRVAHALGFSTSQYFSLVFRKVKGCTPRDWRLRGGR
ncbi:MAG TPA: AraC family transcriptional regulator [Planctomycetota bacterium]|nr:AraC family transcriptional regulator [Planctomycetota bacterium]